MQKMNIIIAISNVELNPNNSWALLSSSAPINSASEKSLIRSEQKKAHESTIEEATASKLSSWRLYGRTTSNTVEAIRQSSMAVATRKTRCVSGTRSSKPCEGGRDQSMRGEGGRSTVVLWRHGWARSTRWALDSSAIWFV